MNIADWLMANGDSLQFTLFFALLGALMVAERWLPRRRGSMDRAFRWPANGFLTLVNLVAMTALPVSFISAALWARSNGIGVLNLVPLPWMAVAPVTLLVRAFISFATHYLNHHVAWFWRVHRVHHLDTELDVTTTVRFHPLEFAIGLVPGVPIVVAFGLAPWILVAYETLDVVITLWSHSNVRLPEGIDRVLRYVVVTPDLHRVHHSAWVPETNSNFGAVFPIWDLVFGTFRAAPRDGHAAMRLGLDEVRGRDAHRPLWLLGSVMHDTLGGAKHTESQKAEGKRQNTSTA